MLTIDDQQRRIVRGDWGAAGQSVSKGESLVSLDNERQRLALKAATLELTRAVMESKNLVPFKTAASEVLEAEQELDAAITRMDAYAYRKAHRGTDPKDAA